MPRRAKGTSTPPSTAGTPRKRAGPSGNDLAKGLAEAREQQTATAEILRAFIELHGSKIWVTSQIGQGATFTFTLPMRRDG